MTITCANRLAEILGPEIVKDKGLNVSFIISKKPPDTPVTSRVIPTLVFDIEPSTMKSLIRKWCNDNSIQDFDLRNLIDWDYYKERFGNSVLKIVSIPAALQGVDNPCPKIPYPDWLNKKVKELKSVFKQRNITNFFNKTQDIEDIGTMRVDLTAAQRKRLDEKKAIKTEREDRERLKKLRLDNPVGLLDDFNGWMETSIESWRAIREQRRENPYQLTSVKKTHLTTMFKNFDQAVF